jgi:hypothetical protein
MPIGRQTHSEPLFTLTMFGLLVVACIMAAAVVAEQPRRRAIQCGRCGQAIPATCAECGQSLPREKPAAATEQPTQKSRPTPEDDGLDIVSPMIFGF